MQQPGVKREMGGHQFQMGGPGTTGWWRPWLYTFSPKSGKSEEENN